MRQNRHIRGPLGASLLLCVGLVSRVSAQAPAPPLDPSNGVATPPSGFSPSAAEPGCDCADRRGLSRWAHHKQRCKQRLQRHFLGYADEFIERPLGAALYATNRAQVANGEAAMMVFYHYDFIDKTSTLNLKGMDKLREISSLLPVNFAPVIVERTPGAPSLAEARRLTVLAELARSTFPIPAERVVIGPAIATGRTGTEAIIMYGNRLSATQAGSGFGGLGSGGSPSNSDTSGLSNDAVFTGPPR
jgi:hypothetical protein